MSAAADLRRAVLARMPAIGAAATASVTAAARAAVPKGKTGQAAASLVVTPSVGALNLQITVAFTSPHALWSNDGTRPHIIYKEGAGGRGGGLFWEGAEHPVRTVRHPGNAGKHWFEAAINGATWSRILSGVCS